MESEGSLLCSHVSPLVHILRQMNPIHNFPHYFPEVHSSIIFPSTPKSSKWCLPFWFSNQNFVCISHLSYATTYPARLILPHLMTWTAFG